jgi:AcrR family transcriptional regulator
VATRFADRSDLAATVWRERAAPALLAALQRALSAAGLLQEEASPAEFQSAMQYLARPDRDLCAALELLIMSIFDSVLAAEVEQVVAAQVQEWCTPQRGRPTRAQAARRAYLLIVALGLIAVARRPRSESIDLTGEFESLQRAFGTDEAPRPLPKAHLQHLEDEVPFDTGDPIHDALLGSVLRLVAAKGYDGASTARIARDAKVAEANIFLRHDSKLDLFIDASARHQAYGFPANAAFQQQMEAEHGPGVTEAVMIREMLRPEFGPQRAINVEELRVSWHDEGLLRKLEEQFESFVEQQAAANPDWPSTISAARVHVGLATGFGIPLLAVLAPGAGALPFDVVTVPLLDTTCPAEAKVN